MKFNWGTGIIIFLMLFLSAAAVFIVFAVRQGVSLVERDYYEKGVDYTEQMAVDARSQIFYDAIDTHQEENYFIIDFEDSLVLDIDSGSLLMFRPSNSSLDLNMPLDFSGNRLKIPETNLNTGRYILKLYWYSGGLKYQVDKTVEIF